MEEGLRCRGLAAVVGEVTRVPLTASRRHGGAHRRRDALTCRPPFHSRRERSSVWPATARASNSCAAGAVNR
jgi:hypothetical protein